MLLALDAGNTNITIGVFEGEEFKGIYRLTTKLPRTSDEFGLLIVDLIKQCGATLVISMSSLRT